MNSRLYFMVSFLFKITASVTFTYSVNKDQSLTLQCHTTALDDTILFKLDGNTKGGCSSTGSCSTGITGYQAPTQSGTTITEMVITYCNVTTDTGSWTCTYGGPPSDEVKITDCSVVINTTTETNTGTPNDNDGIVFAILIVCLLMAYSIVVAVRFCMGSTENTSGNCFLTFCQFIEEKFFDCCGCESSQESEDDPGFFKDKVCTLNSLLGFTYLVLYGVIVGVIVLIALYYGFDKYQEVLVIGVGIVIVLVFSFLCLLVVVWMLMKFIYTGASRSPSFIQNGTVTPQNMGKSQKTATFDKRQQPDGDEGPQSTPKDPDARHLTTGRPLPPKPDIASPQTGSFDSVNSPRPIVLAPIENPNILPSIDTLDEQKTDTKLKDKKKKKKKKKDEGQDNPAYVQDNNVLT